MGLVFPLLFLLNLIFLIYWLLRFKRIVLITLIPVFFGWTHIMSLMPSIKDKAVENPDGISVMSYNVRLFDLYNWTDNLETRNRIFDFFVEEQADILCLQEFYYSSNKKYFNTLDTLQLIQPAKNYHVHYSIENLYGYSNFGIVTFSKFPIIKKGVVDFGDGGNNLCIYTDIVQHGDTMRIYNAHLASLQFAEKDYEFLRSISDRETEEQIEGTKQIANRLRDAFRRRAYQSELILKHIKDSPYPTILCGDLNDSPTSYAYHLLRIELTDSFVESGNGLGATYNGVIPTFRIDYIFHSSELKAQNFRTVEKDSSDHFPVICNISFKD